jgi:hypothetical protein
LQPFVWEGIYSKVPIKFDPSLQLLKAETISMADPLGHRTRGLIKDVWSHVHSALWYASRVKESSDSIPELMQILNKLGREVDGVIGPHVSVGSTGPGHHKRQVHWSSTQGRNSLGSKENTFLGLMAQFCILPFLRMNMPTDPNWRPSNRCMSLLENAVFGLPGVTHPIHATHDLPPTHVDWDQRIETVGLLLENGASRKQSMLNGDLIIDEVQKEKSHLTHLDSSGYWVRVDELLNPKRTLKMGLKTTFNWVAGRRV